MNSSTNNGLLTCEGSVAFDNLKPKIAKVLSAVNKLQFLEAVSYSAEIASAIAAMREQEKSTDDNFLADLFVLENYIEFFGSYGAFWKMAVDEQFGASWTHLQDALDLLRVVKRFSNVDVAFFEVQLVEVEKLYPYNLFCSIGMTVARFECNLCGNDICSMNCPHMPGNLYKGVMAVGVARDVVKIDHIALVENPRDKRCVLIYDDSAEQFRLVRYFSSLLSSKQLRPLDFSRLRFSKRNVRNPNYIKLGRNNRCFCGSGKKFKVCCESKEYIANDHVDIIRLPSQTI